MKIIKEATILALGVGLSSIIVLTTMFYWVLIVTKKPLIIITFNSFGEFWIEFLVLHIIVIFVSVVLIIKLRKYEGVRK